jgi:predicted ester cyclase
MPDAATETRSPAEIVREVFEEVLNRRDADALASYWHEDIVEEFPVGTFRGRDQVRAYFAETFAAIPDIRIEAQRIAGEGETVFVKWRATGTFDGGPWMGIEPTGDRIELDGMDCFTIRDGLVVHNHVIYDAAGFGRQIGMLPQQDSAADRAMTKAFNARVRLRKRLRR